MAGWTRRILGAVLTALCLAASTSCPGQAGGLPIQAPRRVDSLVWGNPGTTRFIRNLFERVGMGKCGALRYVGIGAAHYDTAYPWRPPAGPADSLWVFSPDKLRAASVMRYYGEPDNSLELFNRRRDGRVEQLVICGTPCLYLGVRWVDNDRFIFVQTHEYFPEGAQSGDGRNRAVVTLYDLANDSVYVFQSAPMRVYPHR